MASVRHELCDPEDPEVTFRVGAARHRVGEDGDGENVELDVGPVEPAMMDAKDDGGKGEDQASHESQGSCEAGMENQQSSHRKTAGGSWSFNEGKERPKERIMMPMPSRRRPMTDYEVPSRAVMNTEGLKSDNPMKFRADHACGAAEQCGSHRWGWREQLRDKGAGLQFRMPGSAFAAGEYLGGAAGNLRGVNPVGWHLERRQLVAGDPSR